MKQKKPTPEQYEYFCDCCKKQTTSKLLCKCDLCYQDVCGYCQIKIIRNKRERPESGYWIKPTRIGIICIPCANKKLELTEEIIKY